MEFVNDLFTTNQKGRFCIHKKTETMMLIKKAKWFRGHLTYDVLVPETDQKGKTNFCSATYGENEIELIDMWLIPIENNKNE